MNRYAIIGGTGFAASELIEHPHPVALDTPYGAPSADYITGELAGLPVIVLARHGSPHTLPPHKINYRANIHGLKQLGVDAIIALAAVGGITERMAPGCLAVPDQLIDYSYGRAQTFFDDHLAEVTHVDFTQPYSAELRQALLAAAHEAGVDMIEQGVYGVTQGPRLETAAEIRRLERDGCDLVGMTAMPEAVLAREQGMAYASIALVANWAAGKTEGEISMASIEAYLKQAMTAAERVITQFCRQAA
ncbi:MAG: S-methyl-5'-thioinosine phosphorylase [Methylococcales bacterium]|nr:S-methyl-5'-thioinosine phosphorylase [Methylococcales bacterium]